MNWYMSKDFIMKIEMNKLMILFTISIERL